MEADAPASYHPRGYLLFAREGVLRAQRFDVDNGTLTGEAVIVANNLVMDASEQVAAFSVSASGSVAYRQGTGSSTELTWFDRSGQELGTVGGENSGFIEPRISPNGRQVAARGDNVWLVDVVSDSRSQFTFGSGGNSACLVRR